MPHIALNQHSRLSTSAPDDVPHPSGPGSPLPFSLLPWPLRLAIREVRKMFSAPGADKRVLAHYELAISCIIDNLADDACQLMLMLVVTVASSRPTLDYDASTRAFVTARRPKQPRQLALALATRMCWLLYPEHFPLEDVVGADAPYPIGEMAKKIEQKGGGNRMLCGLGWATSSGRRRDPRTSELQMPPRSRLLARYADLLAATGDPRRYFRLVFGTDDPIWVARCASIVVD